MNCNGSVSIGGREERDRLQVVQQVDGEVESVFMKSMGWYVRVEGRREAQQSQVAMFSKKHCECGKKMRRKRRAGSERQKETNDESEEALGGTETYRSSSNGPTR